MTLKIKSITIKNFMSVGNVSQAVRLDQNNFTLVLGENLDQGETGGGHRNGVGKTTIANALSYALYGQALTNIKKDNLINKINGKHMLVTLIFEKDGVTYRIERGRKPAVMKFYVNNKEMVSNNADESQGDMRETQKDIDALVGMSHDMFKHIVALNTYTEPFLSAKASEQRAIIEQLLGITLLSEKSEALKLLIKETKDEIIRETSNIDATTKANERIQQSISKLETMQRAWETQKRADLVKLQNQIQDMEQVDIDQELTNHQLNQEYSTGTARIKSLTKEKVTLESAVAQANRSLTKCQEQLEHLKTHRCPACDQQLQDHQHQEMLAAAEAAHEEAQQYLNHVLLEIERVALEISNVVMPASQAATYYSNIEDALRHQNNLETTKKSLSTRAADVNPYQSQIDDLVNTALQPICWDRVNELTKIKDHQEFLLKLLTNKDSFIRKTIIDQNLNFLNKRLAHYLSKMRLPHLVSFQNDLSVEITQLGQDLDFDNLSRGERNRLILGLSLAFRDVWENLYQTSNLLFIDELIDSGMDSSGVEDALTVFKEIARARNKNIFLISHKEELIGRVSNILKVVKENGFTSFNEESEE